MSAQQCLDVGAETIVHRREMSDGLTSADDGEMLAPVLDRVEEVSEVPSGVGGGDIRHVIRLSENVQLTARLPLLPSGLVSDGQRDCPMAGVRVAGCGAMSSVPALALVHCEFRRVRSPVRATRIDRTHGRSGLLGRSRAPGRFEST